MLSLLMLLVGVLVGWVVPQPAKVKVLANKFTMLVKALFGK